MVMWILILIWAALSLTVRTIYRLYFHPLAGIPGPKLTAATHLVEFYHNVVRRGMFIWEIEKMHKQYGPIVRINPREIHINDAHYYDEVYASGARVRDKDPMATAMYSAPGAIVATVGHVQHRARRRVMNPFFSKAAVTNLEPMIQEKITQLIKRLEKSYREQTVVELHTVFQGFTADVATHHFYGSSYDFLEDDEFSRAIQEGIEAVTGTAPINKLFPMLGTVLGLLPPRILTTLRPATAGIFRLQEMYIQKSLKALADSRRPGFASSYTRTNPFEALFDPAIHPEEKSLDRLLDQQMGLLGAGSESTTNTLTVAFFHLLQNKLIFWKLRRELCEIMPNPRSPVQWSKLEKLPYLSGVVNEALRLSFAGASRFPRVAPEGALTYRSYTIPAGTPVSISSYFVHMDPQIFPEPESFDPERWVRAAERGERLSKFIASFTKGTRVCLGINLAYAEIYTVIAAVVRNFELVLHETTAEDVRFVRDLLAPRPRVGGWRVKARVIGVESE
ncbi:benzoate 4-monooxygenase cytochrome P450 [Aspergillus campestris IBT 28561]|uniref:Benzoate 4-monooxygenase cytochrome P450 n=1 Tax=Aspergillus campestris (strain IBT 28561) TaxID=1392248 RepID=A0A2I1D556_ASPC2|nr:benzoate 4-monooxygenase cytochrome P450 [Aspergillus campestris IBT 28561]PKY05004.1 benzoate 4-monooxygenase cytochrome P450 [Aspergillus campestris IBT 28561]